MDIWFVGDGRGLVPSMRYVFILLVLTGCSTTKLAWPGKYEGHLIVERVCSDGNGIRAQAFAQWSVSQNEKMLTISAGRTHECTPLSAKLVDDDQGRLAPKLCPATIAEGMVVVLTRIEKGSLNLRADGIQVQMDFRQEMTAPSWTATCECSYKGTLPRIGR